MSYNVYPTPDFKKHFKKLYKKYPSLRDDLRELTNILANNPKTGISMGHGLFKVRMSIRSKDRGKSGGARIITYIVTENKEVYLIYIYDKSRLENITKQQIEKLLKKVGLSE